MGVSVFNRSSHSKIFLPSFYIIPPTQLRPFLRSTGIFGLSEVGRARRAGLLACSVLSSSDAGGAQDATQRRCWILVSVRMGGILRMILWAAGPPALPLPSADIKTCRDRTDGAWQPRLTIQLKTGLLVACESGTQLWPKHICQIYSKTAKCLAKNSSCFTFGGHFSNKLIKSITLY